MAATRSCEPLRRPVNPAVDERIQIRALEQVLQPRQLALPRAHRRRGGRSGKRDRSVRDGAGRENARGDRRGEFVKIDGWHRPGDLVAKRCLIGKRRETREHSRDKRPILHDARVDIESHGGQEAPREVTGLVGRSRVEFGYETIYEEILRGGFGACRRRPARNVDESLAGNPFEDLGAEDSGSVSRLKLLRFE